MQQEQWLTISKLYHQLGDAFAQLGNGSTPVDPPDRPPVDPPTKPPTLSVRTGRWIEPMRLSVALIHERPDNPKPKDGVIYVIKDLFTTRDGSWDRSDNLGSADPWARESYLKPSGHPDYFDDAGGATHLFAAVIGLDGRLQRGHACYFWSDGFAKLADNTYTGYRIQHTKEKSGWANLFMAASSSYAPERGESGPWCWCPAGAADVVCGGGLPARQHISTFAVWQAVRWEA